MSYINLLSANFPIIHNASIPTSLLDALEQALNDVSYSSADCDVESSKYQALYNALDDVLREHNKAFTFPQINNAMLTDDMIITQVNTDNRTINLINDAFNALNKCPNPFFNIKSSLF